MPQMPPMMAAEGSGTVVTSCEGAACESCVKAARNEPSKSVFIIKGCLERSAKHPITTRRLQEITLRINDYLYNLTVFL